MIFFQCFASEETEEVDTTPVCDYNPTKAVDLGENRAGFIGDFPSKKEMAKKKINKTYTSTQRVVQLVDIFLVDVLFGC